MATGWASPSNENLNYARLCRLLIGGGKCVLREIFDSIHSPSNLHTVLQSEKVFGDLSKLKAKRILTVKQWDILYPTTGGVTCTSEDFDITLLFALLRDICNLTPPSTGWDKPPAASDLSKEADLVRIKWYRNEVYAHITETAVSDADFEKLWTEISAVLVRLGPHYKPDIDRLKVEPMYIDFIKELEEWEETEKSIKTTIKDSEQRMMEKMNEILKQFDTVIKKNAEGAEGAVEGYTPFSKDGESPEEDDLSSKAEEFVEKRQLPEKKGTRNKTWTLIAGLLGRKKDEELMDQLIEKIKPQGRNDNSNQLLTLHCLYEYSDEELSKRVINKLNDKFRARDGTINLINVDDTDCYVICYLLSIFKLLNEEETRNHPKSTQSFVINGLLIAQASISLLGVTVFLEALPKFPTLTKLVLLQCGLNDACFKVIAKILASTKITHLDLACDRITAQAIRDICAVLSGCRVEGLCLADCGLDDECFKIISQTLPTTRITHLDLMLNSNITAQAIRDICAALSDSRVEEFKMFSCGLDDECIKIIAQTLPNTSITHLNLGNNNKITDEGVMYLCTEVSVRDCHVKEINLLGNPNITDHCIEFVKSLLEQNKPDVRLEI